MAHIKSAREIAMEKSKNIDRLSPQEMAEIKYQAKIDGILAKFYKNQIEPDDLWRHLKGISNEFLVKAQNNFIQSLTYQSSDYDIEKRKSGLLAIENLKESNRSSDIEYYLQQVKKIQEDFFKKREQFMLILKEELEKNPQKRLQTFQQGNQIIMKELSLEEALEQDQKLKQQLQQLEKQYKKQFVIIKEKLSDIINKNDN